MKPNSIFTMLALVVVTLARAEDKTSEKAQTAGMLGAAGAAMVYPSLKDGQFVKDLKAIQTWKNDTKAYETVIHSDSFKAAATAKREIQIKQAEESLQAAHGTYAKAEAATHQAQRTHWVPKEIRGQASVSGVKPLTPPSGDELRKQAIAHVDEAESKLKKYELEALGDLQRAWKEVLKNKKGLLLLSDDLAATLWSMPEERRALYFLTTPEGKKAPHLAEKIEKGLFWSKAYQAEQTESLAALESRLTGKSRIQFPKLAGLRIAGLLGGVGAFATAGLTVKDLLELQQKYTYDPKKLAPPAFGKDFYKSTAADDDYDAEAVEEAKRAHARGEYDRYLE